MSRNHTVLIFFWIIIIYIAGLFVPLMNNDSAHHANIALHMYLTGDLINLVDKGQDYLDKPHLHFWLSNLAFHLFGATGVAYKIPSLLFSLLGLYATFKLGQHLYNSKTGRLAACILGTSFAFVLANNDVRMDAILTASILFSVWQLVLFADTYRWSALVLGSLGLALGFSTKGMIGVAMPGIALGLYLLEHRGRITIFHWKWLLVPVFTFLFIIPVLYCYYLQFDLHPEKIIRGFKGVSGIKFILWSQNFERWSGDSFGSAASHDPFFFIHTFLWAFLSWSILALTAMLSNVIKTTKVFIKTSALTNLMLSGTLVVMLIILSSAGFKLPHYLNILFPFFSIMLAAYLMKFVERNNRKTLFMVQGVVVALVVLFALLVNLLVFPLKNFAIVIALLLLFFALFTDLRRIKRKFHITVLSLYAALLVNFLFNTNYYPQLLHYQAGHHLAAIAVNNNISPEKTFYLEGCEQSNSFDFYTTHLVKSLSTEALQHQRKPYWIYTGDRGLALLQENAIPYKILSTRVQYHVSAPKMSFLNPLTRPKTLQKHYLLTVSD